MLFSQAARAQFSYTTTNGAVTITGYTGASNNVIIPATTNNHPITSIGNGAFYDCSTVTNVTMGNNVTNIGDEAFYNCYALTSVTIGNSVANIGDEAFFNCVYLRSVIIPNSVTSIGADVFYYCGSLTNAIVGNSVTNIGNGMFDNCDSLKNATIGSGVASIGSTAFFGCSSLTNISVSTSNPAYSSVNGVVFNKNQKVLVTFPEGIGGAYGIPSSVTSIGTNAFLSTDLTSVAIPNTVTNIVDEAFYDCFNMTNITVNTNNAIYSSVNGVLFNKSQTSLLQFPSGLGGTYIIPNSVTNIGAGAFADSGLWTATIPNTVLTIDNSAYEDCLGLSSVTIGSGVTNIGNQAFDGCENLANLTFLGSRPGVGAYEVFYGLYPVATVYYYYGTSNWGINFDGLPTVMLYPPPKIGGSGKEGMQTGGFYFTITGAPQQTVIVEASTNLMSWAPIWTNTLSQTASTNFTDTQSAKYHSRFYRAK